MNLAAYVLAADPTWIRTSVLAYYPYVSRIVVSFDRRGRGWSGEPVPARRCVAALKSIDRERKVQFAPGDFSGTHDDLMAAETAQRQAALDAAAEGADWVLQIDTDEVLPDAGALSRALVATHEPFVAVSWPMRVLYRRLGRGRFLEVANEDGSLHVEYPGPVAVRSGTRLDHARWAAPSAGPLFKVPLAAPAEDAAGAAASPVAAAKPAAQPAAQPAARPAAEPEPVMTVVDVAAAERAAELAADRAGDRVVATASAPARPAAPAAPSPPPARPPAPPAGIAATPDQVAWHNSWARSPRAVRRKVMSWGHGGPDMLEYYDQVWLPSAESWEELRDIHPLQGPRWPRLVPAPERPFRLHRLDRPR
jgi:hypothetical protein